MPTTLGNVISGEELEPEEYEGCAIWGGITKLSTLALAGIIKVDKLVTLSQQGRIVISISLFNVYRGCSLLKHIW